MVASNSDSSALKSPVSVGIVELTPASLRCMGETSACPAVFRTSQGNLLIVGRRVDTSQYPGLAGRIAEGEEAVEIEEKIITGALSQNTKHDEEPSI